MRIDKDWTGPALVVKTHNGVDSDVSGDYCVDCAGDIADAIRSVIEDEVDRISHGPPWRRHRDY